MEDISMMTLNFEAKSFMQKSLSNLLLATQ